MSETDDICPQCGQKITDWGDSDEERTPVDERSERFAQANEVLRQAALESLEHAFNESQRGVLRLQGQLDTASVERDKLKTENSKLKLALRNCIKKKDQK